MADTTGMPLGPGAGSGYTQTDLNNSYNNGVAAGSAAQAAAAGQKTTGQIWPR